MKLKAITEARYDAPPVDIKKLERLLNVVAKAVPFIGYGASVEDLQTEYDAAFLEVTGMEWHQWNKR